MSVKMHTFPSREAWKPIKGYEGLYEVSNLGRIKGYTNNILKPYKMPNGYLQVCLYKDGKSVKKYVHKIVAEAFIPNSNILLEVNHKDENKENNVVSNLEWRTHQENLHHGSRSQRQKETLQRNKKLCKAVDCLSRSGDLLHTFESVKEASENTGANHSAIIQCCKQKSKYKTAGGYVWKYHQGGVSNDR